MKNKIKAFLALVLSVIVSTWAGCFDCQPKEPTPPPAPDTEYCKPACEYLSKLTGRDGKPGCEESRPLVLKNGKKVSCTDFCESTQKEGRSLNPKCWLTVHSCGELETTCHR